MNQSEIAKLAAELSSFKPSACSCATCRSLCEMVPCSGTPQEIKALIDAGHVADLLPTIHLGSVTYGLPPLECVMIKQGATGGCSLYKDGKCSLHDRGLKPSEGRFSNHFEPKLSFPHIAATWMLEENRELVAWIMGHFEPPSPIEPQDLQFLADVAKRVNQLLGEGMDAEDVRRGAEQVLLQFSHRKRLEALVDGIFGGGVTVEIVERQEVEV